MGHHHNKGSEETHCKMKIGPENLSKNLEDSCSRCGSKGHLSRTYHTRKHLVKLYQASLKGKGEEINFTKHHDLEDHTTHLDTSNFIEDFFGKDDNN